MDYMQNISKGQARDALKRHLIKVAEEQSKSLDIEERATLPAVYCINSSKVEHGPEDYYCVRFPNENPSARHMLDGRSRYILISKLTGEIMADGWGT